jgi:hypothetical protein
MLSNRSAKFGNCAASSLYQPSAPLNVQTMSVPPSHIRLKLMGGNTYQPKAEAVVTGSQ